MSERQLFVFWQFNGGNKSQCNQTCPYCYGGDKENKHYWNGDVAMWEKAFERLNRDIYFVFSYGESLVAKGFLECVEMIGKHPNWTLCVVSNVKYLPEELLRSRLVMEHRLFVSACWHPLGVENRIDGWENFKKNILRLKAAGVPMNVMYLWYPPQIQWFPAYFDWLDNHDFRVSVRRFVEYNKGWKIPIINKRLFGKYQLAKYSDAAKNYIYASTSPKVIKYGLNLVSPKGMRCTAGRNLILVKSDGDVALCADSEDTTCLGNIFDVGFKLSATDCRCPSKVCGGDYGMLHLIDPKFGPLLNRLGSDNFVSQVMGTKQTSPIKYKKREEMMVCLSKIKQEPLDIN